MRAGLLSTPCGRVPAQFAVSALTTPVGAAFVTVDATPTSLSAPVPFPSSSNNSGFVRDAQRDAGVFGNRAGSLVHSTRLTPDGAAPITAAAALTPITSPAPEFRSSSTKISDVRAHLSALAASRIAALARGRAARVVTAQRSLEFSLARRFRATPLRSLAASQLVRFARFVIFRRRFRRGGERRAAAAAAATAAAAAAGIMLAAPTTPAPPIEMKMKMPVVHRGRRGSRTPSSVYEGNGSHSDMNDHGSSDDDNDRSCFTPPGVHFGEYAHAAGESVGNDIDVNVVIGDNGMPLSSTATEVVGDDVRPSHLRLGAQAELTTPTRSAAQDTRELATSSSRRRRWSTYSLTTARLTGELESNTMN